jgi:predicted nuclease of predicted toxin-antitoxin system
VIVWVDAQLSPALAPWIQQQFALEAVSVRALGLRDSKDREIFEAAKAASAIVLTKVEGVSKLRSRCNGKRPS